MKRFVTYIYIYDKCEKQKNIGFIKVDVNDDILRALLACGGDVRGTGGF